MVFRLAKFCISLTAFALLTFPFLAHALDVPSAPSGRVSDYAKLLSDTTKSALEKTLEDFEKTDTTQIVVVIFPSLDGESLEDFSMRLASTWQIGQKGTDNGVILLIFKNDRQMRIEVGYGLEDKLTDAVSSDIIRNVIVPEFKNGDFDAGIDQGIKAIIQATRGAYLSHSSHDISFSEAFLRMILALFFATIFFMPIIKKLPGQGVSSYTRSGWSRGGFSGGSFSGGGSSFSGGGGSFGGGGASGRW
jgi:uncharacterized protein